MDIYIAVVAKDRSKQSDSQYLGRIKTQAADHDQDLQKETEEPQQIVEIPLSEPQDTVPIALSDEEYQQTLIHQTIEIPAIAKQEAELHSYI